VFRIADRIARALTDGRPVVALESTVVTHGLPAPQNLELAHDLEATVRRGGAEPATVGVLAGELVVGLEPHEIVRLAKGDADKASLWNLGALLAAGRPAGTTVATTLHAASAAGIEVFATGGIGGVHDEPFDESADLAALARTPAITVCAGPKSILDAASTLERLESLGVAVVGYRSERLAGFHLPETDLELPIRCDRPEQIATAYRAHRAIGLAGGLLVSNPVSQGLDPDDLERALVGARRSAAERGIRGKASTPFLLAELAERTEGRSVEVNLRLLHENAALASEIAASLLPAPTVRSPT
jgi:pseudouridine-5'-phosphate glycosidase